MKTFIDSFDRQFTQIHSRSGELVRKIPDEKLYWQPREKDALFPVNSCGEYILRSAGKIEQTFGGLTVKLWDDPFEWTLPEQLSSGKLILEYLAEVEETRRKGFALFASDEELSRELPAPEKLKPLVRVASTSARYSKILSPVESSSGKVHSNGSSQSFVVMPPKVCSTFAALRKTYSPQENAA